MVPCLKLKDNLVKKKSFLVIFSSIFLLLKHLMHETVSHLVAGPMDVAHWLCSKTSGTLLRSPAHALADTFQSTELTGENKSAPHSSSGCAGLYKRHSKAPGGTEEFGLMGSQAEFLCLWPSQSDKGCHPQIPFNPLMQHYWHLSVCLKKFCI